MPKRDYSCDVIIVNYNAGAVLKECVASVREQGVSRVIVVDNASMDDSLANLKIYDTEDNYLLIRNKQNYGFSSACNTGLEASSAQYLLFLNPDCMMDQGSLHRMIDVLDSSPEIGMVGGFLCNIDGSEQPGGRRVFPTPRRAFMRAFGLARLGKIFPRLFSDFLLHKEPLPEKPMAVEAISGACMLVKRSAVEDVGMWDEGYFLHCEDLDWCMRFRQKGYTIMFVPDAKILHLRGICSRSRPYFVEWHKHRGMIRFYKKHFRYQYPGLLMWLVSIGVWLRFGMVIVRHTSVRIIRIMESKRG